LDRDPLPALIEERTRAFLAQLAPEHLRRRVAGKGPGTTRSIAYTSPMGVPISAQATEPVLVESPRISVSRAT
jgi:hypothetical protein